MVIICEKRKCLGDKVMRAFDYIALKNQKWDSETVAYIAAIHEAKGKQDLYIRQKPQELEKLV